MVEQHFIVKNVHCLNKEEYTMRQDLYLPSLYDSAF